MDTFLQLNIRSVVDLRSPFEYHRADGPKLLDAVYPVYKVITAQCYVPSIRTEMCHQHGRQSRGLRGYVHPQYFGWGHK